MPPHVDGGVELGAEQQGHVRQPDPHQQHDDRGEGPVDERQAREGRDVQEEGARQREPQRHARDRAGADPLEAARRDVRRGEIGDRVDQQGAGDRGRPADHPPHRGGGVAEPEEAEDARSERPAQEDEQEGHRDEHEHGQRAGQVAQLAMDYAAALLDPQDDVERRSRRPEGGGRAPDGRHQGQGQRADGRSAGRDRRLEPAGHRGDRRLRRADLPKVRRRFGDEALLSHQSEDADPEQQRRKQRQEGVIGQRGCVMGHRVVDEARQRALEVAGLDERSACPPGRAVTGDGRRPARRRGARGGHPQRTPAGARARSGHSPSGGIADKATLSRSLRPAAR